MVCLLLTSIEFLIANLKEADLLNNENLKQAFNYFDADRNGSISQDELKRIFAGAKSDKILDRILKDADLNHDGKVKHS